MTMKKANRHCKHCVAMKELKCKKCLYEQFKNAISEMKDKYWS